MTFRTRLFIAFSAVVAVPLAVLLLGIRFEVGRRLSGQFDDRVRALADATKADFEARGRALAAQLTVMANDLGSDNRLRQALRTGVDRKYVLDYAGESMRRAGLAFFQVQDSAGRIVTSGHFRNQFDQVQPLLGRRVAAAPGGRAILRARAPDGLLTVLARADSVTLSGERLWLLAGVSLSDILAAGTRGDVTLSALLPGDSVTVPADDAVTAGFEYPFVEAAGAADRADRADEADTADEAGTAGTATVTVSQSVGPLVGLRRSVDKWFAGAALLTLALALALAAWISSRMSRPLLDLAAKTSRIDLDRLDESFQTDGEGEIGDLSRLLGEMTNRLRTSMTRLREAERRATVGDLARQLNHDVKNGLVPVRNVFRHLAQVARDQPEQLPAILLERQKTIEAGISYLENLARNYARLTPALDRQPCDLNAAVTELIQGFGELAARSEIRIELGDVPPVAADPLVIRRILENLVNNAVESLGPAGGVVTISTANADDRATVRLSVADEGKGMSERELERAFEDFYTTKPGGTGLGLSIVRRLVLDLNGSLRVETAPGSGTRFIIDLPVAA